MISTPIHLSLIQIEYSCSPGGVDTWELYSISDNFIYSHENINEVMKYIFQQFPEHQYSLQIKPLKWWHNQVKLEEVSNG